MIKWRGMPVTDGCKRKRRGTVKFKTQIKTRFVEVNIGGHPEMVPQQYEEKVPVPPRDWDQISTKAGFGMVGVLTMISIVWSTVSIGSLLGGGIGFMAALLFDISWAVCLILEWKSRYDAKKRAFPRNLGWVLLAVTMVFIGWHGLQDGNLPLAVIGACVSLFAKVLWLGIMKHVDRDLSDDHRKWVEAQVSKAHAMMAVAEVQRQVARMQDDAAAHKLAIEWSRNGFKMDGFDIVQTPTDPSMLLTSTLHGAPSMQEASDHLLASTPEQLGPDDEQLASSSDTALVGKVYSVPTGDGTARAVSEDAWSVLNEATGPAMLVRALAACGISSAASMLAAQLAIRPDIKAESMRIAIKRGGFE